MTSPARSSKTLEDRARFGLGVDSDAIDQSAQGVLEAEIGSTITLPNDSVGKAQIAGGFSKVSVVAGEDETTTHQITVTGMAVGDEVVAVLVLTTAASIATLAAHTGTLTAGVDKITPGTEVDNTSNQYIVFWNDLT